MSEVPVSPVVMKLYRDKLQVPESPSFIETKAPILPVMTLDAVKYPKLDRVTKDISAAGGYTIYYTVPVGKRWTLFFFDRDATTASSAVVLSDDSNATVVILQAFTASSVQQAYAGLTMAAGWTLSLANTGNGADNAKGFGVIYAEEDAY